MSDHSQSVPYTELGITEIAEGRTDTQRQVVASRGISTSQFRAKWQTRRPEWLAAFLAEATGVWFFTLSGTASTATYIIGESVNIQLSSFLQIAFAYAVGIGLAVNCCASTSGGHFHPGELETKEEKRRKNEDEADLASFLHFSPLIILLSGVDHSSSPNERLRTCDGTLSKVSQCEYHEQCGWSGVCGHSGTPLTVDRAED